MSFRSSRKPPGFAMALLFLTVLAQGCSRATPSLQGQHDDGQGQLFWHLVDDPVSDVSAMTVTVTGVNLKPCEAGWINHDISPQTLNLLDLQNGAFTELIGQLSLPSGTYCEARLILEPQASITLIDQSVHELKIPSASKSGFKIKGTFPIDPSMATLVTVDFDAKNSLHVAGKGKYILEPVIEVKSVVQFPAPPVGSKATVLTPDGGGSLTDPSFELFAGPGAVSAPTLIWCVPSPDHVVCGPDGTTFDEPVDVAIKAPLDNIIFDDVLKTALMTHDGEPVFTVVDETTGWLYGRATHFSWFGHMLANSADAAFGKYFGEELPANIGSAGKLKSAQVDQGKYHHYHFKKYPGWRQTFCVEADQAGDVDLYTNWFPIVSSTHNGTTQSGAERFVSTSTGKYECVSLDISQQGFFYVAVHGKKSTHFTPHLFTTKQTDAPPWLVGQLRWPLDNCGLVTFEKWGPFNSAWGNGCAQNDPFYDWQTQPSKASRLNLHTAVDIACESGNVVKASCNGVVKYGIAGSQWGNYVFQTCKIDASNTVTVAYVHLGQVLVKDGDTPNAGDPIGDIFDISYSGELDHLHYAICIGACTDAYQVKSLDEFDKLVRLGALHQRINPDCHTNPSIFDVSTLPPDCQAVNPYAQGYGYCQ